eukprot:scaffold115_cov67-Phaeocystis_antarctica.AAC.2
MATASVVSHLGLPPGRPKATRSAARLVARSAARWAAWGRQCSAAADARRPPRSMAGALLSAPRVQGRPCASGRVSLCSGAGGCGPVLFEHDAPSPSPSPSPSPNPTLTLAPTLTQTDAARVEELLTLAAAHAARQVRRLVVTLVLDRAIRPDALVRVGGSVRARVRVSVRVGVRVSARLGLGLVSGLGSGCQQQGCRAAPEAAGRLRPMRGRRHEPLKPSVSQNAGPREKRRAFVLFSTNSEPPKGKHWADCVVGPEHTMLQRAPDRHTEHYPSIYPHLPPAFSSAGPRCALPSSFLFTSDPQPRPEEASQPPHTVPKKLASSATGVHLTPGAEQRGHRAGRVADHLADGVPGPVVGALLAHVEVAVGARREHPRHAGAVGPAHPPALRTDGHVVPVVLGRGAVVLVALIGADGQIR